MTDMLAGLGLFTLFMVGLLALMLAFDAALDDIYRRSRVQRDTGRRPRSPYGHPAVLMVLPIVVGAVLIVTAG